jgi:NAD(P)-dependent dehydrogenase (short-subunit alcohol dehydrogenase family)
VAEGAVVVIGGTSGLGRDIALAYAQRGRSVVLTGRDQARADAVAADVGSGAVGLALDLTLPHDIADALASVGTVDRVVLAAIDRDHNSVREYAIDEAIALATLKLVGYTEVLHALRERLSEEASVLIFGGLAKDRPYPGSTTVSSVNGAVSTMIRTFALELAPVRVNALHPGIVGDSPQWSGNDAMLTRVRERTPTGRLVTIEDVTDAAVFLLENRAVNGVNLVLDGGTIMM